MFAGIDTHKATLAVAVIDHAGRVVTQLQLPNQDSGYIRLLAVLTSHQVTRASKAPVASVGRPPSTCLSGT